VIGTRRRAANTALAHALRQRRATRPSHIAPGECSSRATRRTCIRRGRAGTERRTAGRVQPRLEARRGRSGWAAPELLDSYHTERQPAGERVLMHTRAQAELGQRDERMAPVRALLQSIGRSAAGRRGWRRW
jgi:hypothetical protein